MPFLQAVFCFKGFDDRSRFFSTSILSLLSFIILSAIFADILVLNLIILALLVVVLTCSTKRRLHDAKLTTNWQLVPGGLFLFAGGLSLLIGNTSSYYLLLLPLLSTLLLLTYPSKSKKNKSDYIWGYCGPVDLSIYQDSTASEKTHSQRIEPTLQRKGNDEDLSINDTVAEQNISLNERVDAERASTNYQAQRNDGSLTPKQADVGELIRLKLLSNRKFQLSIIAIVSLTVIIVLVSSIWQMFNQDDAISVTSESSEQHVTTEQASTKPAIERMHLLNMPDNFNLYLSQYNGVIIHWQADEVDNGKLWSLSSATGDKSCQKITFNKGSTIRPLDVNVENNSEYFANFSPLDSNELIQAIAFRGKFSLCGYNFSLKGTQAILGKHNSYAPFLDSGR